MKADLLHIFMIDFTRGWGVRKHSHPFYQIWYVLKGEATYFLNEHEINISKGDLVFLPPGTLHELPVMYGGLLRYVDIKFEIGDSVLQEKCSQLPLIMRANEDINDIILKCREYWYEKKVYSEEIAQLVFEQLIFQLLQIQTPCIRENQPGMPMKRNMDNLQGVVKEIVRYINDHYVEEFALENLSSVLRYNKTYLCKLFKDATGITIVNYLNYVRVSRAYDLICYTSNSISNISLMVGYSSVHYFARIFKRICGLPPGEVRELQKDSILRDIRLHGNFNYRYYVNLQELPENTHFAGKMNAE